MPKHVDKDKQYYLEEELLLVENSGEIPEVAYHGSLHFLTEDREGPLLILTEADLLPLKKAVFERYRRILFRDLNPKLRNKRIFRGLLRCIANWDRFCNFCHKEGFDSNETRGEMQKKLELFLQREIEEIRQKGKESSINCGPEALLAFMRSLGLDSDALPENWESHCSP